MNSGIAKLSAMRKTISHLKKVFSPDIGVEPSPQVLDILYSMPAG
jgi:hypothetical protein